MLLVLVDGLPSQKLNAESTPYLFGLHHGALEPGFGFSINIYPELFGGLQPDGLGFFNKWTVKTKERYVSPGIVSSSFRRLLDSTRFHQPLSRAIHKGWERAKGEGNLANVPFSYLPYYDRNPDNLVFGTSHFPTVFSQLPGWRFSFSYEFREQIGKRDPNAVSAANLLIESSSHVFVLLGDLDGTAHKRGLGQEFDKHLRRADEWCRQLAHRFLARHGDNGVVVVVSDHGMSETKPMEAVSVDLEANFGAIGYSRYIYFVDAPMLRVWIYDPRLLDEIIAYLESLDCGSILTEEDREYFGVTNSNFGDLIYLLEDSKAFYPSFFGALYPKAVHGYDPRLPSQQAVIASSDTDISLPTRARDVYAFLLRLVSM